MTLALWKAEGLSEMDVRDRRGFGRGGTTHDTTYQADGVRIACDRERRIRSLGLKNCRLIVAARSHILRMLTGR